MNDLLDWQPHKQARTADPDTSHAAAQDEREIKAGHRKIVYEALKVHGALTSEEIAGKVDLEHWEITRRAADLKNGDHIHDSGERRRNSSGRQAIVWAIGPAPAETDMEAISRIQSKHGPKTPAQAAAILGWVDGERRAARAMDDTTDWRTTAP